jgi:ankyrin repeat protein
MRREEGRTGRGASRVGAITLVALLTAATAPESPVADAARRGDVNAVRELLARGADVNAAQGDGMTALHWAAEHGDAALVDVLLKAGASVRAVTRNGAYTPLHLGSRAGEADVVEALLGAGSDPEAVTSSGGARPLHFAALSGDPATVTALLDHKADPNGREREWGQTPLIFAAATNRADVIRVLIQRGADPSLTTEVIDAAKRSEVDNRAAQLITKSLKPFDPQFGQSPATTAAPRQVQAAIQAARDLQRNPGEVKADGPAPDVFRRPRGGEGGMTALLHAARAGRVEAAAALLDGGADVDQGSGDGTTPLLIAIVNGHYDLAMMLLERGADPNKRSLANANPLYATIDVQWLPHGPSAEVRAQDQQRTTYMELMRALLVAGADPDVRLGGDGSEPGRGDGNRDGATAFWRAAYGVDIEAMRLLVSFGADPSIPTRKIEERRGVFDPYKDGDPSGLPPVPVGGPAGFPIHAASGLDYRERFEANSHRHVPDAWLPAMKYLIEELHADVNARDHNGYTALHNAAARGDNEVIQYLVSKGADIMVVSRRGQTTVDMANGPYQRISPFPATIALLEKMGAKNNHNCVSCQ